MPSPTRNTTKNRTSHACDRCRAMRTKCSGGIRCTKCVKDDAVCVYGDRKRERNKKDLTESADRIRLLQEDNRSLCAALRSISITRDIAVLDDPEIQTLLEKYSLESRPDDIQSDSSRTHSFSNPRPSSDSFNRSPTVAAHHNGGETHFAPSAGSPGRQGELVKIVDLDHGNGVTGFLGKMSEMLWMQRSREYLLDRPRTFKDAAQGEVNRQVTALQDLSYYTDDSDLLLINEDNVDQLQWPSYKDAMMLSEAYFYATQGAFMFVPREEFFDSMYNFPRHSQIPSWDDQRWLAVTNLVWAVGSKWLHATRSGQELVENHLVFYARARALGLDHRILLDHPNLEMVEGVGLLAFYLLTNGSISRARNVLGQAVRHATALGLHLKVADNAVSIVEQERRARICFSLYSLEILIAEITGRPIALRSAQMTISAQLLGQGSYGLSVRQQVQKLEPDSKDLHLQQATAESGMLSADANVSETVKLNSAYIAEHFRWHIKLCHLSDRIALTLYTDTEDRVWSQTQEQIHSLQTQLTEWVNNLPDDLRMAKSADLNSGLRTRLELAMYYHSVSMILHRPCLCEIVIENESEWSRNFNLSSAKACVGSAIALLSIIPDDTDSHSAYRILPWWTLLHYICQATAVLLLELCLDCQHYQGQITEIVTSIRKAMAYLWCLSQESSSAYRAWRIFLDLLIKASPQYGGPAMFDLVEAFQYPKGWTESDEQSLCSLLA